MQQKEEKKFSYILIDANNLFYRVAVDGIQTQNITEIYRDVIGNPAVAFFDRVEDIKDRFGYEGTEVFLLFDNPGSVYYKRREVDSSYKHNRERTKLNQLFISIIQLLKIVSLSYSDNYRVVMADGYEADDLVKPLIDTLELDFYRNCLVVSNDLDWSRSISDYVYWYNHKKVYDKESFLKVFGFEPSEDKIILWKAIKGDKSDCVEPGIKNMPKDLVNHIVNNYQSVHDLLVSYRSDEKINLHWRDKIRNNADRLKLNHQLVSFVPVEGDIRDNVSYGKRDENLLKLYLFSLGCEDRFPSFTPIKSEDFFSGPIQL